MKIQFAILLILGGGIASSQDLVVRNLSPIRDNTIYEESLNSNGGGEQLFTGENASGGHRRLLLAFDLSSLPADADVRSATLSLTMDMTRHGEVPVSVHRLVSRWGEGSSNAGSRGGAGVAPTPGDATWTHRFHPSFNWTAPGGDFAPAASAATVVAGEGQYLWTSSALAADVATWRDGRAENFGWILVAAGGAKRFHSRESATLTARPVLTVTYETFSPPAPENLELGSGSDTGIDPNDRLTADNTPTILGHSRPGTRIVLLSGDEEIGSGPGGPGFSIETTPLPEGPVDITAVAISSDGRRGAASAPLVLFIDTIPPGLTLEPVSRPSANASKVPLLFKAILSEPVVGFGSVKVTAEGTARPRSFRLSEVAPFDRTTYLVSVSGMDSEGSVTLSITTEGVTDRVGNPLSGGPSHVAETGFERFGQSPRSAGRLVLSGRTGLFGATLTPGDIDYASLVLPRASLLRISTSGPLPTSISAHQRGSGVLKRSKNSPLLIVAGPGTHYIRVEARDRFSEGPYRLRVEILRPARLRPDLLVGARRGDLIGNGVFNASGRGQTQRLVVDPARPAIFACRVICKGDEDLVTLRGGKSLSRLRITYRIGNANMTAPVMSGRARFTLSSGAFLDASVILRNPRPGGNQKLRENRHPASFRLTAISMDRSSRDCVRGIARVRETISEVRVGRLSFLND